MHKIGGTWRRGDKYLMANKKVRKGFSYRERWRDEGSALSFDDWLKEKGITSQSLPYQGAD